MFEYDVGVRCPVSFSVDFVIPTSQRYDYDKTLLVNIVDFYRTIRLTVFRPARNLTTTATFGMLGVPYSVQHDRFHHHHHHLEIYSAPITFAAIGAVQKSYEQQQTLTTVKSKGKIMGF